MLKDPPSYWKRGKFSFYLMVFSLMALSIAAVLVFAFLTFPPSFLVEGFLFYMVRLVLVPIIIFIVFTEYQGRTKIRAGPNPNRTPELLAELKINYQVYHRDNLLYHPSPYGNWESQFRHMDEQAVDSATANIVRIMKKLGYEKWTAEDVQKELNTMKKP